MASRGGSARSSVNYLTDKKEGEVRVLFTLSKVNKNQLYTLERSNKLESQSKKASTHKGD